MFRSRLLPFNIFLIAVSQAAAQTFTSCDPLNTTCPADKALGTTYTQNFTSSEASSDIWNITAGSINWQYDGAEFTITNEGQSPTMRSLFYIFFGRVSTIMKAAPGIGIVSSIVLESDDLDEVDWEVIGGNNSHTESNFFGKANTTSYDRAVWHPIDDNQQFHNYTTVWTSDKLEWYIDDNLVRTLNYNDSLANYGKNYPQTPMYVQIGIWAGGDPTENSAGTVEWAGGEVNYNKGPFTMVVQQIEVEDFSTGSSYTYGDKTGDWQSIEVAAGNSTIANKLAKPTSIRGRYYALSNTAKIGIAISAISFAAISAIALAFCCIKNRRAGRKEKAAADAEYERYLNKSRELKRIAVAEEEIHPRVAYF